LKSVRRVVKWLFKWPFHYAGHVDSNCETAFI